MPAWGIRTALVALRTFMAEEGTGGQVGGMEASKEVRERMAKSSKQWRCDGCGGKKNEEIIEEWWQVCREKGINVEEEAGLEELPEGLKLGFKEQFGKGETKSAADETVASGPAGHPKTLAGTDISARPAPVPIEGESSKAETGRSEKFPRALAGQSNEHPAEASSSPASPPSTGHETSPSQPPRPPSSEASTATAQAVTSTATGPDAPATPAATPILDKAISGLVLALLFMVLKKVLYNPNVIAYDY